MREDKIMLLREEEEEGRSHKESFSALTKPPYYFNTSYINLTSIIHLYIKPNKYNETTRG